MGGPQSHVTNQFRLNTHPEWDLIPAAAASTDPSSHWWQPDGAPLEHQGTSTAWPGELIPYPEDVSGQNPPREEWILAVPCFTLSNPHGQIPLDIAGVKSVGPPADIYDLDQEFANWYSGTLTAEMTTLLDNYSHGLVQFWRFTELPEFEYPPVANRPVGTSDLPFIVLPNAETSAWRLDWAVVEQSGSSQVLLFVATFGGFLYAYDITDLPDQPRMANGWVAQNLPATNVLLDTWTAPDGIFRNARLNVRALAVDKIDEDTIHVYAGVPGYGLEALTLERQGTSTDWAFASSSERIETAGSPHDVEVRPAFSSIGLPKTLLVSDGPAGYRIYGEAP